MNFRLRYKSFLSPGVNSRAELVPSPLGEKNDKLIIHVGTNNLKSHENLERCADEIVRLGESIKKSIPETGVVISVMVESRPVCLDLKSR
jgi:hypothetical protein